jgi:hypothetical protein
MTVEERLDAGKGAAGRRDGQLLAVACNSRAPDRSTGGS